MTAPKRLKFAGDLAALVLSGHKTVTWRIDDDKDIRAGDVLSLVRSDTGETFASADVVSVSTRTFGTLTPQDRLGHETFPNDAEMLSTYGRYYGRTVTPDTPVKIVAFRLRPNPPTPPDVVRFDSGKLRQGPPGMVLLPLDDDRVDPEKVKTFLDEDDVPYEFVALDHFLSQIVFRRPVAILRRRTGEEKPRNGRPPGQPPSAR